MFVPGGRDPAVGALDARDAELLDVADERIGDAAHSRPMPKAAALIFDGQRIAHLRDARAVKIEPLVVGPGVLVVDADDVADIVHGAAGETAPEHLGRPRQLLPKMLSPCRADSSPP
jgi:hypothetical protein